MAGNDEEDANTVPTQLPELPDRRTRSEFREGAITVAEGEAPPSGWVWAGHHEPPDRATTDRRAPGAEEAVPTARLQAVAAPSLPPPTRLPSLGVPPPPQDFADVVPKVQTELIEREEKPADARFGDYVLLGRVAGGGMAEIQLAVQVGAHGFQKPCVIKRITKERLEDTDYQRLFREEGRICTTLRHPNIVKFYEFDEVDEVPYLAMELVDGVDAAQLHAMAPGGAMPLTAILEIGARVSDALAYAHTLRRPDGTPLRIIHRDISPQNILVSREGEVKLADFGIAVFEGRGFDTGMGPAKGKLRYIAPEQLSYRVETDERADIFSLGMVMAELIAGQPIMPDGPLNSGNLELIIRDAFARVNPRPSRELELLIVQMTKQDPDDRPTSAAEVGKRIRAISARVRDKATLASFVTLEVAHKIPPAEKIVFGLLKGRSADSDQRDFEIPEPSTPLYQRVIGTVDPLMSPDGGRRGYPTAGLIALIHSTGGIARSGEPDVEAPTVETIQSLELTPAEPERLPTSAFVRLDAATIEDPSITHDRSTDRVPTFQDPEPPKLEEAVLTPWWWILGAAALCAAVAWILFGY